jgi:peptide-methionine (S)-S-oxide reductase
MQRRLHVPDKKVYMKKMSLNLLTGVCAIIFSVACTPKENPNNGMSSLTTNVTSNSKAITPDTKTGTDTATFGTGCFWCTEAIFEQVNGVLKVTSGYSGGHVENPTYEQVCNKTTGHAEVVQLVYDPKVVSYDELLEIFWQTHDPTTLNRQGNDVGPQYRSVVFYHNNEQQVKAAHYKTELDNNKAFDNPIVTAIEPYKNFYSAENYHQNYYSNNGSQPYCYFVIKPKLEKFEKVFKSKMKKGL